jgi:O-antigen/teichoic acid export membrane protein
LYEKIVAFGLFIFSGTVLNVVSRTVDVIIISSQSTAGLKDTAVFVTATYLITLMEVPQRSIVSIATPIIAEAWKDRNISKIMWLYQKTSLNLLIIGLAIWGCILLNMDNAIKFLGSTYAPMKEIVVIMGIAKLIDLGTGLNSQILLLSKFWKIDFITNTLFVVMSIPLNYILINEYGVIGSAFANLIALSLFNFIRFFYIWKLFKLQPFTAQTFYALLIALVCIAVLYFIPSIPNIFIDVFVRSVLFLICFATAILSFKISADINSLYNLGLEKLKAKR